MPRGRKIGKYNGRMSFKVSTFTRAAMQLYSAQFGMDMQKAFERIIRERVELDGCQDNVANMALAMVQAQSAQPVE